MTNADHEATVRDGRQAPFKQLPDAVMDDDSLSNEAKLTYWYLKRIAGYTDSRARVSVGRLAEKLHYSRSSKRSVRSWVDELVKTGWLDVVHHTRKTSDGKTQHLISEYIVHATAEPPGQAAPEPDDGVGAGEPLEAREPLPTCSTAPRVGAGEPPSSIKVSTKEGCPLEKDFGLRAVRPETRTQVDDVASPNVTRARDDAVKHPNDPNPTPPLTTRRASWPDPPATIDDIWNDDPGEDEFVTRELVWIEQECDGFLPGDREDAVVWLEKHAPPAVVRMILNRRAA